MRVTRRQGTAPIPWAVLAAAVLLLAAAVLVAEGHAASLGFTGSSIGAANVPVSRCTTVGLSVVQTVPTSSVTSVVVAGFPSTCGGANVRVAVNNGTANSSGSGTVPAGGGSVTVTLAVAVAVAAADQIDLIVTGP